MAELKHNSEVESTPKTERTEPSEKKVSSEVQQANQSELKPKKSESTESKEETTEKKTDTPSKEAPLEKKEETVEIPQETKPQEEEKKERPAENVPLQTREPSTGTETGSRKLTQEETDALKDKIRADINQMKESPSGYKDFENGVRDVPTDQPAKLSSKNFDKLYEQRGYSPEEIKEYKESFKGFPEQDKSLNNAARHPDKTDADVVTARHITHDEPVNVYSNERGASGKYSTPDEYTKPSEVQKNLATPDYNTGEYKNESTLKTTLDDGRQNTVVEGTVAPQKADGKVFTEDRPGGGKQILTDGGYEGGGITKGETTRLEPSSKDITSVKGIDNEKPLGKIGETDKEPVGEQREKSNLAPFETKEFAELKDNYFDDLKSRSEYPETIDSSIKENEWKKISPEKNSEMREDFSNMKNKLISDWEDMHGEKWPTYTEDVYSPNGKLIRREGDKYDAHHIQPLTYNGKNSAENITPLHASQHFDKQGVHSPNSPYGLMDKYN